MYWRPLTSQIFEPRPRLTTKARSSGKRDEPSTPPGMRSVARSSNRRSSGIRFRDVSLMIHLAGGAAGRLARMTPRIIRSAPGRQGDDPFCEPGARRVRREGQHDTDAERGGDYQRGLDRGDRAPYLELT